eukprot:CAMPEP_0202695810 /NCGR_PEP_ID=MMETSP1385-20130828/9293_1 /ASSEMBLY_ACC=CAM_ASM_000861 /TAXON_ID=933848 /ORGANISM="Elphidium margaritaceum" /LENGTH=325 /DNA_ID=CAMNT_0049351887 /DNA_START=185 /DNA_END=1162 /DNA_ORIENTATION=+
MPSFSSDQRRLVFVSLIGLYTSWKKCPASVLSDAIFVLPLKRRWIYQPKKYKHQIHTHILEKVNCFQEEETSLSKFFDVLRWKDRQKLVFFVLDDEYYDNKANDEKYNHGHFLIAPFWKRFSEKLTALQDPVTELNYMPLILNEDWWRTQYNRTYASQFGVSASSVLSELYFVTLKFKAMQEILYQSHRDSLLPIKFYDAAFMKPKLLLDEKDSRVQPEEKQEVEVPMADALGTSDVSISPTAITPSDYFGYVSVDKFHRLGTGEAAAEDKDKKLANNEHKQDEEEEEDDEDDGQWVVSMEYMNEIDIDHENNADAEADDLDLHV